MPSGYLCVAIIYPNLNCASVSPAFYLSCNCAILIAAFDTNRGCHMSIKIVLNCGRE